jgi:hypothetical protein
VQPRAALVAVAVVVAALMLRTWQRNADWASELAIWSATVEAAPNSFKAHQGYADSLYESDPAHANLDEVVEHSARSVEILEGVPDDRTVTRVYRLAAVYALEYADQLRARGDESSEAGSRRAFEAAVRHAQRHVEVVTATRGGEEAMAAGRDAEGTREVADAYRLLATAQARIPAGDAALAAAARASALEPLSPLSYRSTAAAQVAAGRYDEAAATFIAGFMVTGDASLRESVVELYRSGLDPDGCATTSTPNGSSLNPACEPVQRHLCVASREAVRVQRERGRSDLAESLETAAIDGFGCATALFAPPS